MSKYFTDCHASAASQLEGVPCVIEDSQDVKALRDAKSYEELLALGDALCYQLRYREAIDIYSHAVTLEPNRPDAYRRRAGRFLSTLQTAKALEDLARCRMLGWEAKDLSYRTGLCLYLSGQYSEAMKKFEANYSQWDDEMRIALIYWHTLSAWRAGCEPNLLKGSYHEKMEVGHHTAYDFCMAVASSRIQLSGGLERIEQTEDDLEYSILAYGLAACLAKYRQTDEVDSILQSIIKRDRCWISYAYLAAWNDTHSFP